jgi:hypothetical protein
MCLHSNQSHPHCVVNFEFGIVPLSYDLLASSCVHCSCVFEFEILRRCRRAMYSSCVNDFSTTSNIGCRSINVLYF